MAAKEIWDYSTGVVACNSTVDIGDIAPQHVMTERGIKNQVAHLGDDDSEEIISFSNVPTFRVELQWDILTPANSGTIYDIYYSTSYGNGMAGSFRFTHPTDGHIYTVRFDSPLPRTISPSSIHGLSGVVLKVLGRAT